jgi:hypothetical protein
MPDSTRRTFLRSAPLAAAAPAQAAQQPTAKPKKAYRRTRFAPEGALRKLSDNLFLLARGVC